MERQRPDINPMPHFDVIPTGRLRHLGAAVAHFFTQHHEIPPKGAEAFLEAQLELDDENQDA